MIYIITTKTSNVKHYKAIKGSFHELKEVNLKIGALESKFNAQEENVNARDQVMDKDNVDGGNTRLLAAAMDGEDFIKFEDRVRILENKVAGLDFALTGIADQSYKILKASNEHVKILVCKPEN